MNKISKLFLLVCALVTATKPVSASPAVSAIDLVQLHQQLLRATDQALRSNELFLNSRAQTNTSSITRYARQQLKDAVILGSVVATGMFLKDWFFNDGKRTRKVVREATKKVLGAITETQKIVTTGFIGLSKQLNGLWIKTKARFTKLEEKHETTHKKIDGLRLESRDSHAETHEGQTQIKEELAQIKTLILRQGEPVNSENSGSILNPTGHQESQPEEQRVSRLKLQLAVI